MPTASIAYISVDIETAGPNPSDYAMLSIGACLVVNPARTFYVELQPSTPRFVPSALEVNRLSLDKLVKDGMPPKQAMARFEYWLTAETDRNQRPVFVGFNAAFDWMFVNDYFHRYLGRNPFGHSALDIKSLFMGATGAPWSKSALRHLVEFFQTDHAMTHNALQDALDQAELFRRILARMPQSE
jgi:DNA polymerase III epsilon subunit-like protein